MIPGGSRHGPLMMVVRPDLEWTLEVDLGRAPKALPSGVELNTPFGSLRLDAHAGDRGYRIEGRLHLEPGLVDAEDVDDLRDFLVAVERHLDRRLEAP